MFRYIYEDDRGFTIYDKYFEYLKSIKKELGDELYSFIDDVNRYNLTSEKSFHDSWLRTVHVKDSTKDIGDRTETVTEISIELLGPNHDRIFHLNYFGVKGYLFDKPIKNIPINHYDLLYHEMRLNKRKNIEHAILFDNEIKFLIEFSKFDFKETLLNVP